MSSYAWVSFRRVDIIEWRNQVDPDFMFLFTQQELRRLPDPEEHYLELVVLTAGSTVLSDRLDVLGIGPVATERAFDELVQEILPRRREMYEAFADGPAPSDQVIAAQIRTDIGLLERITLTDWLELFLAALKSPKDCDLGLYKVPGSFGWLMHLWEGGDVRFLLRAVLLACNPNENIVMDVTQLVSSGRLKERFDPQSAAVENLNYVMANSSPAVVITEGSTDAQFLQSAIRIRYPHLQSYMRFFDFADGAEGSAAAGVRTLKSFAAAGIANRTVLLLDNDTAARDALRALKGVRLPLRYSVLHYPNVELARSYPTLGPNGLSRMDVNGLAGSIEMYLGIDVLTGPDGVLTPVQWRSYIEGVKAYQGEVLDKSAIQKRFREKVRLAEADPILVEDQDWTGLEEIIDSLIEALKN